MRIQRQHRYRITLCQQQDIKFINIEILNLNTQLHQLFQSIQMSLTYRSSFLFAKPSHYTITHAEVQEILNHHKNKLQFNKRSTSLDDNYKIQRLSAKQSKTIEKLSQKSKTHNLNTILKNYNKNYQIEQDNACQRSNPQRPTSGKKIFETIDSQFIRYNTGICPQKLKLFKEGMNYRSKERARGAGVKKINMEELKTYFQRCPQEELEFKPVQKGSLLQRYSTIDSTSTQRKNLSIFKFNRIQSSRKIS